MKKLTKKILSALCAFAFVFLYGVRTPAMGIARADDAATVTNIQHRDSNCNRLLIYLSGTDYSDVVATTSAPGDVTAEGVTMLDKVLLYLNDSTYVTLRTAWNSGDVYYNVWGATNSICVDTKADYGLGKIKYITFLDGCIFPSATTHTAKYAVSGNVTYENKTFGTLNADQTSWEKLGTAKTDGGLAVSVNNVQIRDNRLFFYFDGNSYSEAAANSDASTGFANCNIMDYVTIWTSDTTGVALSDAAKAGGAKFYNLYASGALALEMGSDYGAAQVKMVTIKQGCQFPDNDGKVAFVQLSDITYLNGGLDESNNATNWTVTDTPAEGLKTTSVSKIQVRDNKLFIYLSKQNYTSVAANVSANDHITDDKLLTNIEVYAGETHAALKEAMSADKNAWYNHYGDMGCLAIQLDGTTYTNASVTKIVVKKGCEFPSALSGKSAYITEKEESFVSGGVDGSGQSVSWTYAPEEVYLKANTAHIRGGYRESDGSVDVKLLIFVDGSTDILDAPATTAIGNKASEYNFLDKIMLTTTVDEAPISLRTAYTSETATGELYYNIWNEQNCIAVQLGKYDADQITRIYIPKGTEIPSYSYTSGTLQMKKTYITAENIYLKDWAPTQENHPVYSTNWAVDRDYGDITATGVTFADSTLEFALTGTDYPTDGEKKIDNYFEGTLDCYKYITLDGVSLADYIDAQEITPDVDSWINATAYGTFAIKIEGLTVPTRIIIRKGCQFPIYANTPEGVTIHDVLYYEVSESVMFVKQDDGTYQKAEKVLWKVTFDGENAIEVEDGGTVATLPTGTKSGYKFVSWKLNGAAFTTSTVIESNVNVVGEYVKVYTVTFNVDGGSAVESQIVEEESYATKPEDPTKDGATFLGWVDKDGKTFDFANTAITEDITITAKWQSDKKGCQSGCSGNIGGAAITLSIIVLAAAVVVMRKRKHKAV